MVIIPFCGISSNGALALADALAKDWVLRKLVHLDLAHNEIDVANQLKIQELCSHRGLQKLNVN